MQKVRLNNVFNQSSRSQGSQGAQAQVSSAWKPSSPSTFAWRRRARGLPSTFPLDKVAAVFQHVLEPVDQGINRRSDDVAVRRGCCPSDAYKKLSA
jgi:hypothetical protein